MNPHEPIFVAPPITEIPDYVWSPRYDRPSWIPGRPVKKPTDGPDKSKRWALEEYDALPRVPHKKVTEFQHYFVHL